MIPFYIDAWVSADLGVLPQDLFIILGNAIDNAIEECCQIPVEQEPHIQVSIHQKGKMLAIKVENPCRSQSTPKPGKIHGYGLKNVQRCVDKYNCGCWSHARRKWREAMPEGATVKNSKAAVGFQYCNKLFAQERKCAAYKPKYRQDYRQNKELPLLEEYYAWLKTIHPEKGSKLEEAVRYSLN